MTSPTSTKVTIRGLVDLDASEYRGWVEAALLVVVLGYGSVMILNAAVRGWSFEVFTQGATVVAALLGLVLARRSLPRPAVFLTLLVVWIELLSSLAWTGGESDYGLLVLPVLVLAAGLVFGTRVAVVFSTVTAVSATALVTFAITLNGATVAPADAMYALAITTAAMFGTAALVSVAVKAFGSVLAEAQSSAEHLSQLMAHAPDGILVLGRGGTVESANPAAVSILGVPEEELQGRTLEAILQTLGAETDEAGIEHLADPSEEGAPRTVWWRKGTRVLWVEVTARAYSLQGGVGKQVMLRDVTLRQQALEEQRIVRNRLEEGQRMESVGRLAGGIAHDFRNLLTVVGNSAELIAEGAEGETKRLADEIGEAAARASSLTTQLLAFARKEIVQPVALDLPDVIQVMELGMQHLLGPGCELRLRLPEGSPPIRADRSQLEQVIFNLVKNAGDALEDGGIVELTVTLPGDRTTGHLGSVYEVPVGFVELRVSDDGTGMDSEVLEHAFEPYFTTKAVGQGTGLGLSSVHGVITQAGGQVRVESRAGVGTSVHVLWPTTRLGASEKAAVSGEGS